jgi:hypothetical protein
MQDAGCRMQDASKKIYAFFRKSITFLKKAD